MIYSKHHLVEPGKSTSTLVLAKAGSGKSDWIKSNLLQMDENFIVVDPGGKYVQMVGNALKEHGYKIQVLNLESITIHSPMILKIPESRIWWILF